ncbi:MAG: antibiotic biosynthesis monooxygenase [Ilumatobacteraceae bacterium]|nr:antibiotic biosynthesis monooxygenase [Ilumatobacteraceae bacterium]
MIVITGSFPIDRSQEDAINEACNTVRVATLQEDGCHEYRFAYATDAPGTLLIVEEWRDQEALTAHMKAPHLVTFGAAIGGFVVGAPELFRYEVTDKGPLR